MGGEVGDLYRMLAERRPSCEERRDAKDRGFSPEKGQNDGEKVRRESASGRIRTCELLREPILSRSLLASQSHSPVYNKGGSGIRINFHKIAGCTPDSRLPSHPGKSPRAWETTGSPNGASRETPRNLFDRPDEGLDLVLRRIAPDRRPDGPLRVDG